MKKSALWILALAVFIPLAFAGQGNAVITQAQGDAVINRQGKEIPAASGMTLQVGDVLKNADGILDISVNGQAGCRILKASELILSDTDERSMRVHITRGNAIFNLKKLPIAANFEVESPTAIATVRGTQFWGRVDFPDPKNPVTTFAVREGLVEISPKTSGKIFILNPGDALDVSGGDTFKVRPALDEEMKAMEQAKSIKT